MKKSLVHGRFASITLSFAALTLAGCERSSPVPTSSKEAPTVLVTEAVTKELADFVEFTGWTEAVESVEVRSRVSGYLRPLLFKEGNEVKEGDLLFQIDPRTYDAEVARCEGALATVSAQLKKFDAELERSSRLREKGLNTQADHDQAIAAQAEAKASIQSAQASLDRAKLDLDFTKIAAPISGKTSRARVTEGNLVAADSTLLTTIVSLDPIYAYFDVDERTMLEIQKRIRERKIKSARQQDVEVRLGLANETGFPHVGVIDLVDNRVSASTGTLQVRGKFPNPAINANGEPKSSDANELSEEGGKEEHRILSPGLFVRIQFQLGKPSQKLLVPEQALGQQQGQRFLFVVTPGNKVERRTVTIGRKDGALRVIESGLKQGEQVIVQGQLRVRPQMEVKTKLFTDPQSVDVNMENKPKVEANSTSDGNSK